MENNKPEGQEGVAQTTSPPVQQEIVSGDGIAALFPAPRSETVEIQYKGKLLKFEVMPLSNETFAQVGDKIKISNINLDLEQHKDSLAGMKLISDLYYPAIRVVLPKCGVNPRFIDAVSTDPKVIQVDRLALEVEIELFDKILALSGIGSEKEAERKK